MRAPEMARAHLKAALRPGVVKSGLLAVLAGSGAGPGSRSRSDEQGQRSDSDEAPRRGSRSPAVSRPVEIRAVRRARPPPARERLRSGGDDRQQRQAEHQRRGQVAEARLEAARHAVRAGGGGRGDQPGGRPPGRRGPPPRSSGPAPRARGDQEAGERQARPAAARRSQARGGGRAGASPTRSSRRSGSRARCALRGRPAPAPAPAARSGRGGEPRAAGCRCGRGCAGTSSRRRPVRRARPRRARATSPRGARSRPGRHQNRAGSRKLSLVPAARPAARPTTSSAPRRESPAAVHRDRRPRAQTLSGNRNSSKQEEDPDDVVTGLPRLIGERGHAQRDRAQRQRPGRDPVGPADAPAGKQAAHEPAEVQQRREQVPAERQHPDRVEDFGVGRVEPGQELRRDEVQAPGVAALKEAGGERPVVPGRVEPGHPGAEPQVVTPAAKWTTATPRSPGRPGSETTLRPAGPAGGSGRCGRAVLGRRIPGATRRRSVQAPAPTSPDAST